MSSENDVVNAGVLHGSIRPLLVCETPADLGLSENEMWI
jgi:hypothetical protein